MWRRTSGRIETSQSHIKKTHVSCCQRPKGAVNKLCYIPCCWLINRDPCSSLIRISTEAYTTETQRNRVFFLPGGLLDFDHCFLTPQPRAADYSGQFRCQKGNADVRNAPKLNIKSGVRSNAGWNIRHLRRCRNECLRYHKAWQNDSTRFSKDTAGLM